MRIDAFELFPWLPWAEVAVMLLALLPIALTIRTRRRMWKVVLGICVPILIAVSCGGVTITGAQQPQANVAAPVPDSMSLIVVQNPYVPSKPTLDALNARTGAVRWRQLIEKGKGVTAVTNEQVIYLASGFDVIAVRVSDGNELWHTPLTAQPLPISSTIENPSVFMSDGLVFISPAVQPGIVGTIVALRASTGELAWSLSPEGFETGSRVGLMAVGQGMVFVEAPDDSVFAYRANDGVLVWRQNVASHMSAFDSPISLLFGDGEVFLADQHSIVALHASDGSLAWSRQTASQWIRSQMAVGASSVYYQTFETDPTGGASDYLNSLSVQTGNLQWRYRVINASRSTPVEAGELVYFASDIYLDAVRVSNGRRDWRYHSGSNVGFGTPVIANNVLFVPSHVAYPHIITTCPPECEPPEAVIALNAATGAMFWRVADDAWSVIPIGG
jgi:outer membrane protein assembly factor BamB